MSIHVQRSEPNRANYYILVIGLFFALCVFIFEVYKKTRTIYVEGMPETAKLYVENNVVCESLPCEISLQNWPEVILVVADKHYSQEIPISIIEYFTSERHDYEINLVAFPYSPPEANIKLEEKAPSSPQPGSTPKPKYSGLPHAPKFKPKAELPLECRETARDWQGVQNRSPVLCYYEGDKEVIHDAPGECYASFWVSVKGKTQKLQGFGCMHPEPLEAARRAFNSRIYLPGLKNGRPVEKAVETEIKYGPRAEYITPPKSDFGSRNSLNGDAKVLSCPKIVAPSSMTRSGHCIFEFDLTADGLVSQMRRTRCTHAELLTATSTAFKQCHFKPARTDGLTVERPYMKYQIDVDVYDRGGRKIPVHPSFGDKSLNKPYVTY